MPSKHYHILRVSLHRSLIRPLSPSIISDALASISSLSALIAPNSAIASEIAGVPSDVAAAVTNPALIQSLEAQFASSIPAWYTNLPQDAQSYILNVGPKVLSIQSQLISLESVAGIAMANATPTGSGSYPLVTSNSNGTLSNTTTTNYTTSGPTLVPPVITSTSLLLSSMVASTAGSTSAPSRTSTAAAAQQTVALAAGVVGAIGVVGAGLML